MNLAVIGGYGLLGSTAAFCAGGKGLFDEIYLMGSRQNLLMSHVMDMDQAMRPLSHTRIYAGEYSCLERCDVILLAASMPERAVDNRNEYLAMNLELIKDIAEKIKASCKNKIILCATNPIDVFTYVLYRLLGWPKEKFLGYGYNDTLRLRWALADDTGLFYAGFEGYVLGEHGDMQVPVYSYIKYNGTLLELSAEQRCRIDERISRFFRQYQALDSRRTSGWTSAVGITTVLEAIVCEQEVAVPCSAILTGEYGLRDVSLGVPVYLGRDGVRRILELPLDAQEQARLAEAAEAIKRYIELAL